MPLMDPRQYLARIHYEGPFQPDYETLKGFQAAHLFSVPFENLDIVPLHRRIHLGVSALWDKIVVTNRGGFCYELNGLFGWLLQQAGFEVRFLNARVFNSSGEPGIEFDHLALLVGPPSNPGAWLADVGFGDSFIEPLRLGTTGEQTQGLRGYRLEGISEGYVVWQRDYDSSWSREYVFDTSARRFPEDYEAACLYHQQSPDSSFTHRGIASIAVPEGRITLEEGKLITTTLGRREERAIEGKREYDTLLRKHFGIVL